MQIVGQVNITMPNIPSSLAKVGDKLRSSDINIDAISCSEGPTHSIIHLIVDDVETAKLLLKDLGAVTTSEVIALKVRNSTGVIANIGRSCAAKGINIRMIYATTCGKEAMVYVRVENVAKAIDLLREWEKSAGKLAT
ncbi:hypothetical protein EXS70_00835 [Candidatus Peribacteria bacterium]|nr:hypothetical protein [Candidatus Peribacteria bacterium]